MSRRFDALTAAVAARNADFMGYMQDLRTCIEALVEALQGYLDLESNELTLGEKTVNIVSLAPGAQPPGAPIPEDAPKDVLAPLGPNKARAVVQLVLPTTNEQMPVLALGVPLVLERRRNSYVIAMGRHMEEQEEIRDLDQLDRVCALIYDHLLEDLDRRPTDSQRSGFGFIAD